jgi:hypothetical protein
VTGPKRRRTAGRARLAPLVAAGALIAWAAAMAGPAQAATAPSVSTGAASGVGFSSATLTGTVNPKGSETLYYFQYGLTKAYTAQTGLVDAGAGSAPLRVAIALSGLAPLTVYHFRLVAVNGVGRAVGGDKAFITTRVPLSLQILSSPNPVPFGGAITVQGTLSGTGNGGREVVLQANAFPFTAGFVNVENPELTNAQGGFSFHVLGLTQATQYRVVTSTNPPVVSPVAGESVTAVVSAHTLRLRAGLPGRRRLVRFSGSVAPALDGMHIAIMRMVRGRSVFVAGGALRHSSAARSRFSRVVRVRRGIYRVFVQVTNGALSSTYSPPLLVH